MRKFLTILITLFMVSSFIGCSSETTEVSIDNHLKKIMGKWYKHGNINDDFMEISTDGTWMLKGKENGDYKLEARGTMKYDKGQIGFYDAISETTYYSDPSSNGSLMYIGNCFFPENLSAHGFDEYDGIWYLEGDLNDNYVEIKDGNWIYFESSGSGASSNLNGYLASDGEKNLLAYNASTNEKYGRIGLGENGVIIFNGKDYYLVDDFYERFRSQQDTGDNKKVDIKSEVSSEKTVEKVSEIHNIPALELVNALCLSQALHYDSFTSAPDEITTTYTLYNIVSNGDFRWKDMLKMHDGGYYFSNGPESETADNKNNIYVSPEKLYQDYFVAGKYKYPPQELNMLIEGTQTGIKINMSDSPYAVDVKAKNVQLKDDKAIITATIYRIYDDRKPELLGDAVITLKEEVNSCYFEYKIISYEPKYDKFKDIELK